MWRTTTCRFLIRASSSAPSVSPPLLPPSLFSPPCFFSKSSLCLLFFYRETAMAARCPRAAGQGSAGVQTPSTPSPSRQRPTPSPIQRPQLCSPSASAASHPKQIRGAPNHELLQPRQTSRATPPPSHFPPPSFFSARMHHPLLGFYGVEAGGKLWPVPGGGEGKWISGGGALVVKQFN
uniref:Uncharacterized protein n=1 Tax=Aegilops tauschii subsp. strangulata TaxID=200361 RepID=A0A453EB03_AEGTS